MASARPTELKTVIWPLELSCTIARLASTCPPARLMFETVGTASPVGKALTKVGVVVSLIAVRLTTTALAPAGTPPVPVTCTLILPPLPSVLPAQAGVGELDRVSQIRTGVTAVYAPGESVVYSSAAVVGLVPPGPTTVTSTVPAARLVGEKALICVGLVTSKQPPADPEQG